jgi:hypothetical protein
MRICEEPHKPPSNGAKEKISQILNQNKRNKNLGIEDIIKGK